MLAHHPTTGQPIRILRTEPQIHADLKTLVWLRSTFQPSVRWSRWFAVLTEPEAVSLYKESPVAVILTPSSDIDAWLAVLPILFGDGSSSSSSTSASTSGSLTMIRFRKKTRKLIKKFIKRLKTHKSGIIQFHLLIYWKIGKKFFDHI